MSNYWNFALITAGLALAGIVGSVYALAFTGAWFVVLSILFCYVVKTEPDAFKDEGIAISDAYGYAILFSMAIVSYCWLGIGAIMLVGAVL